MLSLEFAINTPGSGKQGETRDFSPDDIESFGRQIEAFDAEEPIGGNPIERHVKKLIEGMDPASLNNLFESMMLAVAQGFAESLEDLTTHGLNFEDEVKAEMIQMYGEEEGRRLTPLMMDLIRGMTRK